MEEIDVFWWTIPLAIVATVLMGCAPQSVEQRVARLNNSLCGAPTCSKPNVSVLLGQAMADAPEVARRDTRGARLSHMRTYSGQSKYVRYDQKIKREKSNRRLEDRSHRFSLRMRTDQERVLEEGR